MRGAGPEEGGGRRLGRIRHRGRRISVCAYMACHFLSFFFTLHEGVRLSGIKYKNKRKTGNGKRFTGRSNNSMESTPYHLETTSRPLDSAVKLPDAVRGRASPAASWVARIVAGQYQGNARHQSGEVPFD